MRRLEDKIALVTGAGAGIGRAIAEIFAREGAHVIVSDVDGDAAKEVADAIVRSNGAASAHTVDVTDTGQVKALMVAIKDAHGRLDVLVNNAALRAMGVSAPPPASATASAWAASITRSRPSKMKPKRSRWRDSKRSLRIEASPKSTNSEIS